MDKLVAMRNYLKGEIHNYTKAIANAQGKIDEMKAQLAICNERLKERHITP